MSLTLRGPQFVTCGRTCPISSHHTRSTSLPKVRISSDLPVPAAFAQRLGVIHLFSKPLPVRPMHATVLPISLALGRPGNNSYTVLDSRHYPSGMVFRASIAPEGARALSARSE